MQLRNSPELGVGSFCPVPARTSISGKRSRQEEVVGHFSIVGNGTASVLPTAIDHFAVFAVFAVQCAAFTRGAAPGQAIERNSKFSLSWTCIQDANAARSLLLIRIYESLIRCFD